ncbi:transposase [Roseomonas sp. CCTCC AB2023176]|uniref:transposase n=1 Tax=Roseomonas sp. CCTCC AB2023176 TaxID=3342640 RepID=UPI0035D98F97
MLHSPTHRLTPRRPWMPLTDDEWLALWPYVWNRCPQGRQVGDLRARMDAIFELAVRGHDVPWRDVSCFSGKPDTIARFFRRATHNGLWHRLLEALTDLSDCPDHPLRRIEYFVCRAARRAARLGGLRLIFLIRRLGLETALNAPPWLLPNPFYDALVRRLGIAYARDWRPRPAEALPDFRARTRDTIRTLKTLHRMAAGQSRIRRSVRLCWP